MPEGTEAVARGPAIGSDVVSEDETPANRELIAHSRRRLIGAQALQNAGDQIVKASTVLTWLLASLGAPAWAIGLLVPIRESGSMLPQAVLTPWVRGFRVRKWIWVIGGAGQAAAVAAMAMTAATTSGVLAAVLILVELGVFALSRALTSIASKDVTGRTIPKGERGDINGIATLVSGVVAVTVGLGIRYIGGTSPTSMYSPFFSLPHRSHGSPRFSSSPQYGSRPPIRGSEPVMMTTGRRDHGACCGTTSRSDDSWRCGRSCWSRH